MDGKSFDIVADNVRKIQALFPEAVTEIADENGKLTRKIDMEKLNILLGEEAIPADDNEYGEKYGEKYSFEWFGKKRAIQEALKRSTGTLRPCKEDSVDWDTTENLYIEGDNLEVLKLLQDSYMGAVKMIYIDPPYNTGKDFVYKDNYKDNLQNYLELTNTTNEVNTETSGRYHSNWLNMMYPRLKLARNLLTDNGVIFISIDDNELANLRKICDEVFGEDNIVTVFPWQSRQSIQNDTDISSSHEYIVAYAKSRRLTNRRLKESNVQTWFDELSFACLPKPLEKEKFSNPDNDSRGLWKVDPFDAPNIRPNLTYVIKNPNTGEEFLPPNGRCWRTEKESFDKLLKDNRIIFGKTGQSRPQLKVFYDEKKMFGSVDNTWWTGEKCGTTTLGTKEIIQLFNGYAPFDTPKPTKLISQIMELSILPNKNEIILDFFSGSASTAHAVMQLNAEDGGNRKFICVQLPESTPEGSEARKAGYNSIPEIAKERIRRAGKKIKEEQKAKKERIFSEETPILDIGFKVFKLDRSNVNAWDMELEAKNEQEAAIQMRNMFEEKADILREGRTDFDMLYEVILKKGLELTVSVEEQLIEGKRIFVVGDGVMVASFEKELTYKQIQQMIELRPEFINPGEFKVIIADESFATSNDKTNALQLLKQKGITNYEII
ncbi:MAG: site-specific DNA-methyltransferase [Odoribacter sp.]